ncbi:MAG: OsmC family protein [Saprospiraceae bacterium]
MTRLVTIESIDDPFRCICSNGVHTWYADEPESNQGGDTSPSPSELLLSAIGACAAITLRMYARRKEWDVTQIKISLSIEEIKSENGIINRIHEKLEIEGSIDSDQIARLKSLIPKCPVARMVTGQIEVVAD